MLKRQGEKLKERHRELQENVVFWKERAERVGDLNETLLEKLRRNDELLRVAQSKIEEYRSARPQCSFGKKPSMPPLAHKYPSALVVSGD
jgi:hypothetical protein